MMPGHRTSGRLAALTIGVALVLAWTSSLGDAPVVDEVPHIGAGYSYVRMGDMRLNPEHPPLIKDLAGLPLLTLGLSDGIFAGEPWTEEVNGQWTFGRSAIYGAGAHPDTVKNFARLPMLAIFGFVCWLVWKWTRERYGDPAALLALGLTAFSPTLLAHGRLVTTDLGAAAGVLAATYCFVALLRERSRRNFVFAALALGLALLAKFNTVLLAPFFAAVAVLWGLEGHFRSGRHWGRAFRLLGLTALVGITAFVFVVWPVYIAHTWNYPPERQLADAKSITSWYGPNPVKSFAIWAADKPVIRAAGQWALGLAMVMQRNAGGNTIYWLGRVVKEGGPGYFPTVYFLKEPLAWWALVAMALTALAFHHRRFRTAPKTGSWWARHQEEWVWLLWLLIYWLVSVRSTLNIGVRHLLPVYPFTIMLVAGRLSVLMAWLHEHDRHRFKAFTGAIAVLLGWYVYSSVSVHPFYLTHFNELAGGPAGGYRYVVDSNLDWGQDARRFGKFVRDRNIRCVLTDYFGWADPQAYLGKAYQWTSSTQWRDAADFRRRNACDGWIAVSATFLQNSNGEKTFSDDTTKGTYRWLMDYQPEAVIGHSIFVWHIK